MSRKKEDDKAAYFKPIGSLPSLPKCDDGNRQKWVVEYDKVEAELLKPHLAAPGAPTLTLGLRNLPATWQGGALSADGDAGGAGGDMYYAAPPKLSRGAMPLRAQSTDLAAMMKSAKPHSMTTPHGGHRALSQMSVGSTSPRRPMSATSTSRNVVASFQRSTSPVPQSVHQTLRTLFTLLDPPVDFRTSFSVNTNGVDLRWLRNYVSGDRTPTLLTLETLREDMLISAAAKAHAAALSGHPLSVLTPTTESEMAINSPRSAIVLLRNGVTIQDLQMRPPPKNLGVQNDAVKEETNQMTHRHEEERRKRLLQSLREEYREFCSSMSLFSLLDEMTTWRSMRNRGLPTEPEAMTVDTPRTGGNSPMLKGARPRGPSAAASATDGESKRDIHNQRLERAAAFAQELERKARDAELRQVSRDTELQAYKQKRHEEAQQRSEQARKRLDELRASMKSSAEVETDRLRERQRKAAERDAAKDEQRQASMAEHKAELQRKAEQRRERLQQAKQQVMDMLANQAASAAERERIAEERREHMMQEKLARRARIEAEQRLAAEARTTAMQKAHEREEAERRAAERRNEHADAQLRVFAEQKAKQRLEQAALEAERNDRRQRAFEEAQRVDSEKRETAVQKRERIEDELRRLREHRRHDHMVESTLRHLQEDDKRFLVDRQARAQEFAKLVAVGEISEKTRRAEAASLSRKRAGSPERKHS